MLKTEFLRFQCAGIAIAAVAIATILRAVVNVTLNEQIPYTTFYPAVILTALCCGLRWGLAATLLSALAASFWLSPLGRPVITEPTDLAGMALFLAVCGLTAWLSARVREHRKEAESAAVERQMLLVGEQAARQEAERANRAKDDFLAAVSHELRNPLNSIFGWVQLLRNHQMTPDETELAMESIERSARIQTQLINDLMELSQARMGKLRLDARAACLSEIVHSAVQTVLPAAKSKGLRIHAPLTPSVGPVLADADRLHQVVWNLLSNAIKFTPLGGSIEVQVADGLDHAQLTVRDTGEGIDKDFLPLVFGRFQQENGKRRQGGLGLGLAIVKEIVELHGGSISASSPGKGAGSEFTVLLPKFNAPAVLASEPAESHYGARTHAPNVLVGKRILIVDDDAEARAVVESTLRQRGAEIVSAKSVAEAKILLATRRLDVLISDIAMPGADGWELIKAIRAPEFTMSSIPAIALTAYTEEAQRTRAIKSGFQLHLGKPVDSRRLVGAVLELTSSP